MTFDWTYEQRQQATFGSSVVIPTHGGDRRIDVLWPPQNNYLRFKEDGTSLPLWSIDPATLQPPSIDFIQDLARARLSPDAFVRDYGEWCLGIVWRDNLLEVSGHDEALSCRRKAVAGIIALASAGL